MTIDAVTEIEDLRVAPGNRLEALKGDRKGQHSIRINDQWHICFKRLGRFFNMSPQFWLNIQTRYDLEVTEDQLENRLDNEVHALAQNA